MVTPSAMMPGVEAMQMQAAPPRKRAQRQTSSCLECRRRKQKVRLQYSSLTITSLRRLLL
jgi:hypothetical protein